MKICRRCLQEGNNFSYGHRVCKTCLNEQVKLRLRIRRIEVLSHYSGGVPKCWCCGETEDKFLCINHTNGGGSKHRKEGSVRNIYFWLIKNGLPKGFDVLCHNCNMAYAFYKECPHRKVMVCGQD